jgi:hypothetical protein
LATVGLFGERHGLPESDDLLGGETPCGIVQ